MSIHLLAPEDTDIPIQALPPRLEWFNFLLIPGSMEVGMVVQDIIIPIRFYMDFHIRI